MATRYLQLKPQRVCQALKCQVLPFQRRRLSGLTAWLVAAQCSQRSANCHFQQEAAGMSYLTTQPSPLCCLTLAATSRHLNEHASSAVDGILSGRKPTQCKATAGISCVQSPQDHMSSSQNPRNVLATPKPSGTQQPWQKVQYVRRPETIIMLAGPESQHPVAEWTYTQQGF